MFQEDEDYIHEFLLTFKLFGFDTSIRVGSGLQYLISFIPEISSSVVIENSNHQSQDREIEIGKILVSVKKTENMHGTLNETLFADHERHTQKVFREGLVG